MPFDCIVVLFSVGRVKDEGGHNLSKDESALGINNFCTSNPVKTTVPTRYNTFNNMIIEAHPSKGFCFVNGDTMFLAAPGFLLVPGGK